MYPLSEQPKPNSESTAGKNIDSTSSDWNIMVDVTMDDDEDDYDIDDEYNYPAEVPSRDPKIIGRGGSGSMDATTRHVRRTRRDSNHSSARTSSWRCCSWFTILTILGWLLSFILFGMLLRQMKVNQQNDDVANDWENDDGLTPADYQDMENGALQKPFVLRINAGSAHDYTDPDGNVWIQDDAALSNGVVTTMTTTGVDNGDRAVFTLVGDGSIYSEPSDEKWTATQLSNVQTEGKDLYRDERWFKTGGTYEIPIPVPQRGTAASTMYFEVTLYFCEIVFDEPLQRVFQVYIEDEKVLGGPTLDLVSMGGGNKLVALPIPRLVQVSDGHLTIRFESLVQNAKISAIQIEQITS